MNGKVATLVAGVGAIVAAIAAIAAAAVYLGYLNGRIDALDPDAIRQAQTEAIAAIEVQQQALSGSNFQLFPVEPLTGTAKEFPRSQRLIPIEDGICYLVSLHGGLNGDRERVWIHPEDGYWTMSGYAPVQFVEAQAGCWKFTP